MYSTRGGSKAELAKPKVEPAADHLLNLEKKY